MWTNFKLFQQFSDITVKIQSSFLRFHSFLRLIFSTNLILGENEKHKIHESVNSKLDINFKILHVVHILSNGHKKSVLYL